jgi:hypothetical protein
MRVAPPFQAPKMEALNTASGIAKQATTDERGAYLVTDLQPGTYKVTISAPSFASRVQEGVVISQNAVLRLDAVLTVSQVMESVLVSAAAVKPTAPISTTRSGRRKLPICR